MEGVEREPVNIGYAAPRNPMYNSLAVGRKGREEVKKGAWHLGSSIHVVLDMCHKGRGMCSAANMPKLILGSVCNNC